MKTGWHDQTIIWCHNLVHRVIFARKKIMTTLFTCVTWKDALTILCSFSFVACKYLKKNEHLRTACHRVIGFFDLKNYSFGPIGEIQCKFVVGLFYLSVATDTKMTSSPTRTLTNKARNKVRNKARGLKEFFLELRIKLDDNIYGWNIYICDILWTSDKV